MLETIQNALAGVGLDGSALLLTGIGIGCFVGLVGLYGAFAGPEPVSRRFRPSGPRAVGTVAAADIVRQRERDPSKLMNALVPADRVARSRIRRELAHAGFTGRDAVLNFYLVRALLGIVLAGLLLGVVVIDSQVALPAPLAKAANLSRMEMFQCLGILVALGFYAPTYWLRARANARRSAISNAFPNALDLLQISVEAGLGFDAAMARVSVELASASPEITEEFAIAQREILAGRERDRTLMDMAERMSIEEASSFVNVILQSKRFGTSISEALLTYADEMRTRRELRAQEKANRLPVQMSAVMACLMLPALLLISLTPVVIRYVRFFAE